MELSCRGSPPTDGAEDGRRFPDPPPPHDCGGDAILVVSDALVSRLEETIVAKLVARIQRMIWTVLPNKASPAVKSELIGITIPVNKPNAPMKWSCPVCQVQATSEKNLQDHFAGQKHQSNVAALGSGVKAIDRQKAKPAAEPSPRAEQVRTSSIQWSCSTCMAKGTSGSTFQAHLKGKRHLQNITAASREGCSSNDMPKKVAPMKWSCPVCQVEATSEKNLQDHFAGQKHQSNVEALGSGIKAIDRQKAKSVAKPAKMNWSRQHVCYVCGVPCTSEKSLESHFGGKRHYWEMVLRGYH